MPQQSQRRPRVTDLQPWQTDAPLDKSADLPLGWSAVRRLISRACERKQRGDPNFQKYVRVLRVLYPQIFKSLKTPLVSGSEEH